MKYLVIIVVILVVILYIQGLKKVSQDFTLIQVNIENIHPDHIHEKLPILIHDAIVDPVELLRTVFRYYFITIKKGSFKDKVGHSFNIYHAKTNNSIVSLRHPHKKEQLDVKLDKNNVLLVPYKWSVEIKNVRNFDIFMGDTFLQKLFCLY